MKPLSRGGLLTQRASLNLTKTRCHKEENKKENARQADMYVACIVHELLFPCMRRKHESCAMVAYLCLRHEGSSRQFSGLARNGAEGYRRRRAGRPSKQARFIAIEKRITTRHREAPALTMPVTCHHLFELCRRTLSSKLAGTHPTSTHLHVRLPTLFSPCRDQWTPPYARFRIQSDIHSPIYNGPFQP